MGLWIRQNNQYQEVNYQDIWFNGRPIIMGGRECEFRFHAIEKFFSRFKRPVSVLDIGANMGYFSLRLMEKFPGTYVMIEGGDTPSKGLLRLCKLHNRQQTVLLTRKLCLNDLKKLSECEHFDVVMALSIVHHFAEPFQEVFEVFKKLGSYLIFEPPNVEEGALSNGRVQKEPIDLSTSKKEVLVRVPPAGGDKKDIVRTTYAIDCGSKVLSRPFYNSDLSWTHQAPTVVADFKQRKVRFSSFNQEFDWRCGINLLSFLSLNGVYPCTDRVKNTLRRLSIDDSIEVPAWDFAITERGLLHVPLPDVPHDHISSFGELKAQLIALLTPV